MGFANSPVFKEVSVWLTDTRDLAQVGAFEHTKLFAKTITSAKR